MMVFHITQEQMDSLDDREETRELYQRQESLNLNIPTSALVIGVGGVGSWVGLNLALSGVKQVILVDPDIIEKHNLNRTPFKESHIGMTKAEALMELILERRINTEVYPYTVRIEDLAEAEIPEYQVVVDCRDTTNELPGWINRDKLLIIGGYNGDSITLHTKPNPVSTKIWGTSTSNGANNGNNGGHVRYTIVPSWLCPPQLIANLITVFILNWNLEFSSLGERIQSFKIQELIKNIFHTAADEQRPKSKPTQSWCNSTLPSEVRRYVRNYADHWTKKRR